MNVFTFTANIGADAQVQYTQGGTAVCSFNAAVNSGFGDKQRTSWVRCVMFGKKAEGGLPPYLVKGQKVAVSGELEIQEWDAKDGSKQKTVQVVVSQIDLIGDKKAQGQQQHQDPQSQQQQQPQQNPAAGGFSDFDSDSIPFAPLGREYEF